VIPNLYRKTFRLLFSGNEDFSVVGNVYFGRKAGEMTVVAYSVNAISKRQSALNEEEAPTAFGGTDRPIGAGHGEEPIHPFTSPSPIAE
jgi:hypothetical protein